MSGRGYTIAVLMAHANLGEPAHDVDLIDYH